jgi:hypothetical protein
MAPLADGLKQLGLVPTEPFAETVKVDPLTPIVVEVMTEILKSGDVIAPIDVLVRLEILTAEQCVAWPRESSRSSSAGINAGLNKVGRMLRVLDVEARALGLTPTTGKYVRSGKGPKQRLRFSKRGDAESEASYSRHYVRRQAP